MSESISCNGRAQEALKAIRRGDGVPAAEIRALGEECPAEFFRSIIEPLADSFDSGDAARYEQLMSAWGPQRQPEPDAPPEFADKVYVLSRVTLGADVKITSIVLDAMKTRYPLAEVTLVGNRKSAELFAGGRHLEVNYPRVGPVSARIEFARELRRRLDHPGSIVIDPDSRMTQLGLFPVAGLGRYWHFNSRVAGGASNANLTELTQAWIEKNFGVRGYPRIAPAKVETAGGAAINLGVGENDSKRVQGNFESELIRLLARRYPVLWVDRGAGGEEARRVTRAVEDSGAAGRVRFWEGSFAGFASIIGQCELYVGYDSGGQHAAAALGIPLISVFAGAPSERFRHRWAPAGPNARVVNADGLAPEVVLELLKPGHLD